MSVSSASSPSRSFHNSSVIAKAVAAANAESTAISFGSAVLEQAATDLVNEAQNFGVQGLGSSTSPAVAMSSLARAQSSGLARRLSWHFGYRGANTGQTVRCS